MLSRLTRSKNVEIPNKTHVFKPGSYIWAKMDRKFWPGIIISHRDIGMELAGTGRCWVFWFGDHRVSQISCTLLKDFCHEYFTYISIPEMFCKKWIQGVSEALREIGLPETESMSIQSLKFWAKSNLENAYSTKYFVTNHVKSKLDEIREQNLKPVTDEFKECANHMARQIIGEYKLGKVSTLRICMGCYSDKISDEHPLFIGYFCTDCNNRFKKTYCNLSPNLKKEYCAVCGFTGDMLVCMNMKCKFVYCAMCIRDLAEVDAYIELSRKKRWFCFLCTINKTYRGALIPREDWEDNIGVIVPVQKKVLFSNKYKKRILEIVSVNVKMLLSTIETLKNKSGFHYSENSSECIEITENNYPEVMQLLTLRTTPKENFLQNGMPIRVLVCDQRSRSDNNNEKMCPTKIVYEFYGLVKFLNQVQEDPCYWIFEWSNDIDLCQRVKVTRFLKEYPKVSNSERRLVWCNLPLDRENIVLSLRNVLFSEPSCYQEQKI